MSNMSQTGTSSFDFLLSRLEQVLYPKVILYSTCGLIPPDCFKTNWSSHKGLHKAVQQLLTQASGTLRGYDSLRAGVKEDNRSTWKLDEDLG